MPMLPYSSLYTYASRRAQVRKYTERSIIALLFLASCLSILTAFAIVASMAFETNRFFHDYPFWDFLLGTVWSPNFRGGSELGFLPLLWGTMYVSIIALLFAFPIGLMTAVCIAEFAPPRVRSIVKPAFEILAGIPTVVYGLFALVVVGPFLRDYFAKPLSLSESGSSVMTAGLVMGIMLIPFISSIIDDAMAAVPRGLRDAAFCLGANTSETIKTVILPAARPGIFCALILAGSRAIGETMIVVMGAGAAAKMDLNPFEAMTTITVKIVSQLTGDTDFTSPETLVAFALGLTLFLATFLLNTIGLSIMRKYWERYE